MFSLQPPESPLYCAFINFPRFQYQSLHEKEASDKTCVIKTSANSESIHPSVVQWTNEFPKARFRSDSYSILVSQLQAATARTNDFSINISFSLPQHPRQSQPSPKTITPFGKLFRALITTMMMELNYTASFLIFYYPNKDKAMSCGGGRLRNIKRCSNAPLFDNRLWGWMRLGGGKTNKWQSS